MDGSPYRAEAERWLSIAERLLTARDLHAAKSFAIRARDTEPRFRIELAEQIIAVADTVLAGESRIANGLYDCYGILQLARLTQNLELIAARYRQLALLLNPDRNRLAFADHAFRLVSEAWSVLSNSSKKAEYDHALIIISHSAASASGSTQQLHFQPQPQHPPHPPPLQPQAVRRSPRTKDGRLIVDEERPIFHSVPESTRHSEPTRAQPPPPPPPRQPSPSPPPPPPQPQAPARAESETESESGSFWTACPYCYLLFEYPRVYEECSLRCQNCKRAFQAVVIPSPPVTNDIDKDKENYYYCWGFFPLGFSDKGTGGSGKWSPITPMFTCSLEEATGIKTPAKRKQPTKTGPWVYYDDQEGFVAISDSSDDNQDDDDDDDDEWQTSRRKRRSKRRASAAAARAIRTSKKMQHERVKKASGGGEVSNNVSVTADGGCGGGGGGGSGGGGGGGGNGGGSKGESSKGKKTAVVGSGTRRRAGATELGKLDLNVEFSNEVEEPAAAGVSEGNGAGHGVEDNIEGIGFFEGLDEFLSSLPILKG